MNLPMENLQVPDPIEDRLVDRLVDGEVADTERRKLLLRLEDEPGGWRRCALAFLEAQTWREALGPLAVPAAAPPLESPPSKGRQRSSWRTVGRRSGLAAGLAAAFALGWAIHGWHAETAPYLPVAEGPASSIPPKPSPPAPIPLATRGQALSERTEPLGSLEPIVRRLAQQGYSAETQERLVSMELKNGRKLNVPIHEVRVRYVGGRTY